MKRLAILAAMLFGMPLLAWGQLPAPPGIISASLDPLTRQQALISPAAILPQITGQCGTATHCTILTWTASSSAAGCVSPCSLTYNAFRGTTAGSESTTPINSTPITGTTYVDPVTLTSAVQNFYYVVQAVETSGGVTASSANSNEASDNFPGIPASATTTSATAH